MQHSEFIFVLDFGSQYTQLIARRVRDLGVYSEIRPFSVDEKEIEALSPKGIILSGGPSSVYEKNAPLPGGSIFLLGIPILGICYGLQIIAYMNCGQVRAANHT